MDICDSPSSIEPILVLNCIQRNECMCMYDSYIKSYHRSINIYSEPLKLRTTFSGPTFLDINSRIEHYL